LEAGPCGLLTGLVGVGVIAGFEAGRKIGVTAGAGAISFKEGAFVDGLPVDLTTVNVVLSSLLNDPPVFNRSPPKVILKNPGLRSPSP